MRLVGVMSTDGVVVTTLAGSDGADDQFASLYRDCLPTLMRFAFLLCGHQQQAEDAVAETFAKVLPSWKRGQVSEPSAYLRRTLINEINSRGRRRLLEAREERRRSGADRGATEVDAQAADRDAVLSALRRLPVGQRAVLVLRYYEDLPETEAAAVLGVNVGTVKSQTARAMARLRQVMEE